MAQTAQPTKSAEVAQGDGTTVFMDFPKRCWAHVPSDDPKTWYVRTHMRPDDEAPDVDCIMAGVDAIKRAAYSPAQTRLQVRELPYAKGRLAAAWRAVFQSPPPDALAGGVEPVPYEATESES
jgi:hypothetical protein